MGRLLLVTVAAALLFAAPANAFAATIQAARRGPLAGRRRRPGVVVLARDRTRAVHVAAGSADLTPRRRLRVGDRFRVASITKTFVAAVVLPLAGEGRLSLDDTVERWLPGVVPGGAGITIRRLLNHTSGLFDYLDDGDDTILRPYLGGDVTHITPPQRILEVATSHPPNFPPAPGTATRTRATSCSAWSSRRPPATR